MSESTPAQPFAPPPAVVQLVRDGVVDAELAALLSMTVEGGVPTIVAGGGGEARAAVREALLPLLADRTPVVRLTPNEDYAWMPQAGELGWRSSGQAAVATPGAAMVADLGPGGLWGEAAHLAIRALTTGYALLATTDGESLDEVLSSLSRPPVSAIDDELTRLGVVLILDHHPRVRIAHYLRPAARDPGGHVQRLPPASLAAWNPKTGRFDHFAWGVVAELAGRTGRRPIAFEREQAQRAVVISATGA